MGRADSHSFRQRALCPFSQVMLQGCNVCQMNRVCFHIANQISVKAARCASQRLTRCTAVLSWRPSTCLQPTCIFDSDHWLSNSKNVVCVRLTVPAWTTSSLSPPPSPQPGDRLEQMRTWSAPEVVSWARAQDLEGPSAVLFASSVNGSGLLEMTAEV